MFFKTVSWPKPVPLHGLDNILIEINLLAWIGDKSAMTPTCITFWFSLEEWVLFHSFPFARVTDAALRPDLLLSSTTNIAFHFLRKCYFLFSTVQCFVKRQADAYMYIFPMKFHAITLLFLPIGSKGIEIESVTLLFLLRSIALSPGISICLLLPSAGLKIGEELFIDVIKVLFEPPFSSLFLASLGLLIVILIFVVVTVHTRKSLVTVNVLIIFLAWFNTY